MKMMLGQCALVLIIVHPSYMVCLTYMFPSFPTLKHFMPWNVEYDGQPSSTFIFLFLFKQKCVFKFLRSEHAYLHLEKDIEVFPYLIVFSQTDKKSFIKNGLGSTYVEDHRSNYFFLKTLEIFVFCISLISKLVINLNIYFFYILDPLACTEAWTMPIQRVSITL